MEYFNYSMREFAIVLGHSGETPENGLRSTLNGTRNLSRAKAEKLLSIHSELNANWLHKGEGEMIVGESEPLTDKAILETLKILIERNAEKTARIEELEEMIKKMIGGIE